MGASATNILVRSVAAGFRRDGSPNWKLISGTLAFGLLQILAVTIATYVDHSWRLHERDRGLLEHYGAMALLVTDPLLLISVSFAYRRFRLAMSTLPLCTPDLNRERTRRIVKRYVDILHMRGAGLWLYLGLLVVGILSWINNLRQTRNPIEFFGHDVFDSTSFMTGFVVYKIVLFNSWVGIYPLAGFMIVSMCFSTRLILERLHRNRMICPNLLHPDGCYGLASLGTLNICLLLPFILAFSVVFGVAITHETAYASLVVPLLGLSGLFVVVSFVTIKPIATEARRIEAATYKSLVARSGTPRRTAPEQISFGVERLCFALASGSPYSRTAKTLLLVMRAAPAVVTASKFLWS